MRVNPGAAQETAGTTELVIKAILKKRPQEGIEAFLFNHKREMTEAVVGCLQEGALEMERVIQTLERQSYVRDFIDHSEKNGLTKTEAVDFIYKTLLNTLIDSFLRFYDKGFEEGDSDALVMPFYIKACEENEIPFDSETPGFAPRPLLTPTQVKWGARLAAAALVSAAAVYGLSPNDKKQVAPKTEPSLPSVTAPLPNEVSQTPTVDAGVENESPALTAEEEAIPDGGALDAGIKSLKNHVATQKGVLDPWAPPPPRTNGKVEEVKGVVNPWPAKKTPLKNNRYGNHK